MLCVIMNLPTRSFLLASPFGCLAFAELSRMRGFCADHAGEDDDARLLHLLLLSVVVILDAGDAGAGLVGQHARDRGERAHLGLRLARVLQIGHHRIGERAGRTADRAPAVVEASRPPLPIDRGHADRGRHEMDAVLLGALQPDLAVGKGLHRRHRIRLARRPPLLFLLGVARHADFGRDLVVERRDILIGDRPIVRAIVLALDLVVGRQEAREIGEVMQRRAADAPARLRGVAERMLALEDDGRAGRLDAPAPDVGADQILELPVRPVVEHDDLLAGLGQHGCIHRARSPGADDDDIDLFVGCHVTTSGPARCGPCRARRAPRSPPSSQYTTSTASLRSTA